MRNPDTPDCAAKGCCRAAYKHTLCRKHWNMVPLDQRLTLYMSTVAAQMKAAHKDDARFVRLVNAAEQNG